MAYPCKCLLSAKALCCPSSLLSFQHLLLPFSMLTTWFPHSTFSWLQSHFCSQFWKVPLSPQPPLNKAFITDKPKGNSAAWLLRDLNKFRFFHSGLIEVRHGRGIFVLLVLVLPIFDHCVDFLLSWLYLVKNLWPLVNCFNIQIQGISLQLIVYRLVLPNQCLLVLCYLLPSFCIRAQPQPKLVRVN